MMFKNYSQLCTPARVYFTIAVIICLIGLLRGISVMHVIYKLIFALLWTYILAWLCDKGLKTLSWFLVALPYIIMVLAMFKIYELTSSQKQLLSASHIQGAINHA